LVDETIGLVMAHRLHEAGRLIDVVLDSANNSVFDAVIAGCTELPIAIDNAANTQAVAVLSSNEILATTLTRQYYQRDISEQ
jgi:aspartate/glutamate racemase